MGTLKEALYDNLLGSMSDNTNRRNQAEQQIKLLEVVDDYGTYLTEIALDKGIDWPVRQLASVLLKQFVNSHWSKSKEKYSEPELSATERAKIRTLLINALGEETDANFMNNSSEKKLRGSLAYVVSAIAFCDWPEDWPNLFEILMTYLSSGNQGAIYSSMKVFSEICHDICDNQIPTIAPILLPKMYEIFVNRDYGTYLTEIALDKGIDWPVRQLASVLLKQFVNSHWSKSKEKYSEPELSATERAKIRTLLINALGEETDANFMNNSSEKKLRGSLAYVVSAIAFCDWPEDWPNLFEILMTYLSSGNQGAIYSSMKVFSEICHDICDNQIPTIAPILLPKMYEIFVNRGTRDFFEIIRLLLFLQAKDAYII